ncbi:hypothetical protein BDV95DRAFT_591103 [Massariosphaeria phaeospora]|uniref:Uncharacterized protein n=1 Tax=Massariosphaeria phaeospora TaxID=100035 RepID=A0A7C8MFG8_9PLEO|nr:hypothetical protein BDV95DRAFT_591103 [Massariosphaeria phaeospora]
MTMAALHQHIAIVILGSDDTPDQVIQNVDAWSLMHVSHTVVNQMNMNAAGKSDTRVVYLPSSVNYNTVVSITKWASRVRLSAVATPPFNFSRGSLNVNLQRYATMLAMGFHDQYLNDCAEKLRGLFTGRNECSTHEMLALNTFFGNEASEHPHAKAHLSELVTATLAYRLENGVYAHQDKQIEFMSKKCPKLWEAVQEMAKSGRARYALRSHVAV